MPPKEDQVALSDSEIKRLQTYADAHGLSLEDAASALASRGLEARMRRKTRRSPTKNVFTFRGGR